MTWAAANLAGVMTEPPNGLPDLRAVIEAVEALNRPIFGIVEQDMYPVAFDVPMPIAKRTRNYLLSCGSRTAVNSATLKDRIMTETLRVAVIGAGRMGADHIQRLNTRIHGAEVAAVVDVDLARAQAAIEGIPGAVALADAEEALNNGDVNAVLIATPGFLHEDILLKAIAKDIPILCEKPLTPDAESSWKIVEAEQELGHKRIQVGFMRRFDAEYAALGKIIRDGELGELLMLHHQHRNPDHPGGLHQRDADQRLRGPRVRRHPLLHRRGNHLASRSASARPHGTPRPASTTRSTC